MEKEKRKLGKEKKGKGRDTREKLTLLVSLIP